MVSGMRPDLIQKIQKQLALNLTGLTPMPSGWGQRGRLIYAGDRGGAYVFPCYVNKLRIRGF